MRFIITATAYSPKDLIVVNLEGQFYVGEVQKPKHSNPQQIFVKFLDGDEMFIHPTDKLIIGRATKNRKSAIPESQMEKFLVQEETMNGLTLKQLLRLQRTDVIAKARSVYFKSMRKIRFEKTMLGFKAFTQDVESAKKESHETRIIGMKPGVAVSSSANKVLVWCSCFEFLYRCEYALTKNGASRIKYSNGKPAYQTNPSSYPIICKHLFAVGKQIVKDKK